MGVVWKNKRTRECVCRFCGAGFLACDFKASTCEECKKPRPCKCGCGQEVKTPGRTWAAGHNPMSPKSRAKQGAKLRGDNNPAKRPEVRKKIRKAVTANHPSKTHTELWAKLARNMKPATVSKLEDRVAKILDWDRQVKIGYYTLDFADIERKIAIEVQGCYWHSCQKCFPGSPSTAQQKNNAKADSTRASYLLNRGWVVCYLWEHKFNQDPKGSVEEVLNCA